MAITLNGLVEGDKIRVFSAGRELDGEGVFLRVDNNNFLIWVDNHANINVTSLNTISIRKIS
ncbi:hypothetical protein [Bacillus multifaciens]|uniref:hypothetical protein n=1 Tax=Bacillus multifaciens TaxID=3068506 RepID=UPI0027425F49|nr:hypothetical protein [Bacillus sp. WLY-B-L8]MDP7978785.1 hypothetical protein [Bacillus sp. WLY-B-L8]